MFVPIAHLWWQRVCRLVRLLSVSVVIVNAQATDNHPLDANLYLNWQYQETLLNLGRQFGDSLMVDQQGNVWVTGGLNERQLVKITPQGDVETMADDLVLGVGLAQFAKGDTVVSDCFGQMLLYWNQEDQVTRQQVRGCVASLMVDSNETLWATVHHGQGRLVTIDEAGRYTDRFVGAPLQRPMGLAQDLDKTLYVGDWQTGKLYHFVDNEMKALADFGTAINQIAILQGGIYVPIRAEHAVARVSPSGEVRTVHFSGLPQPLEGPYGIAFTKSGDMLLLERDKGRVSRFSPSAHVIQSRLDALYQKGFERGTLLATHKMDGPGLVAKRRVRVYLPPNYQPDRTEPYPVLYVTDGAEAFLAAAPQLDKSIRLDQIIDEQVALGLSQGVVVVAVDATESRAAEYLPYTLDEGDFVIRESKARALATFFAEQLKPYIESNYHVSSRREDQTLLGASFGAFFMLTLQQWYPQHYGNVIALSPALWYGHLDRFVAAVRQNGMSEPLRWFLYASPGDDASANGLTQLADQLPWISATRFIDSRGGHAQSAWAQASQNALMWLNHPESVDHIVWLNRPTQPYWSEGDAVSTEFSAGSGEPLQAGDIQFTYEGEADTVVLMTSWNQWDIAAPGARMSKEGSVWKTTMTVPPGHWAIGISIDGQWLNPLSANIAPYFHPTPTDFIPGGMGGFDAAYNVLE